MKDHLEFRDIGDGAERFNMPYSAAVGVKRGITYYLAGVTAAPIYHSHPHVPSEFDDIPDDPGLQAAAAMENVLAILRELGGDITDVVEMTRFAVDLEKNQKAIGAAMAPYFGDHRPATTSVAVVRLATDPRLILELRSVAVIDRQGG